MHSKMSRDSIQNTLLDAHALFTPPHPSDPLRTLSCSSRSFCSFLSKMRSDSTARILACLRRLPIYLGCLFSFSRATVAAATFDSRLRKTDEDGKGQRYLFFRSRICFGSHDCLAQRDRRWVGTAVNSLAATKILVQVHRLEI